MAQALTKTYTGILAGASTQAPLTAPGGGPFATYAISVKGTDGTLTSWTALLEGSIDGVNWTTLITHNATAGSTSWETTGKPCLQVRVNVTALVLNTATSATVTIVAVP